MFGLLAKGLDREMARQPGQRPADQTITPAHLLPAGVLQLAQQASILKLAGSFSHFLTGFYQFDTI
jgi:hypothetical protein